MPIFLLWHMEETMYKQNAREAVKTILRECGTQGTFWNRHLQSDDVIDIWRETNGTLAAYGEEPAPFDTFYLALQRFREEYPKDLEAASKALISKLEVEAETALHEKFASPRKGGENRPGSREPAQRASRSQGFSLRKERGLSN
jgi:hypothetical protein